jgi:VWFA-related protein
MGCEVGFSRRQLLAALPLLPAARLLRAQDSPKAAQDPNFKTDVKVVSLFATVRDKKDTVVKGLTKDDFLLDEDGRAQTIRYFSQESNLPLTVGLMVDTSGSTRRVLPDERAASRTFLRQVLRPDQDRAFVIHFDFDVELLQDLTGSRDALDKALDELETGQQRQQRTQQGGNNPGGYPGGGGGGGGIGFPRGRRGGGYPGGGGGRGRGGQGGRGGGGTKLYDSIFLGADEIMRKQTGRKALILLSDGEDQGSKTTLSTAIETAQRADTLVYSILFVDSEMGGFGGFGRLGGVDGKKVMQQMSRETGARFFEVSRKMPIEKVFASIEEDLRNQYSIGYTPEGTPTGAYRHIHLGARQKGLLVQTREGYYGS